MTTVTAFEPTFGNCPPAAEIREYRGRVSCSCLSGQAPSMIGPARTTTSDDLNAIRLRLTTPALRERGHRSLAGFCITVSGAFDVAVVTAGSHPGAAGSACPALSWRAVAFSVGSDSGRRSP